MCRACTDDAEIALVCPDRSPELLRGVYLFEQLDAAQLATVAEGLRTVHLPSGRWLYRQGEAAERFYLVRHGQIALFRQSAEGKEIIIALVGPGEMFAETHAFLERPRHDLNAKAVADATLLSFDRAGFRSLLGSSMELCLRLMETQQRRRQMLLDEIERLTLQDATQRVMAFLLDQVARGSGPQRLHLSVPKSVLASRLSIQPETFSRILARLKECHYVCEEGGALLVPRPEQLRAGLRCSACSLRFWGCPGPERLPELAAGHGRRAAVGP